MNIGSLRHRLTLQRLADPPVRDAYGEVTESWVALATVWGSVDQLGGREMTYASQRQSAATHKIVIRYYAGLTSADRVKFGTRIFNIEGPPLNTEERNISLTIMAIEQAAGAV